MWSWRSAPARSPATATPACRCRCCRCRPLSARARAPSRPLPRSWRHSRGAEPRARCSASVPPPAASATPAILVPPRSIPRRKRGRLRACLHGCGACRTRMAGPTLSAAILRPAANTSSKDFVCLPDAPIPPTSARACRRGRESQPGSRPVIKRKRRRRAGSSARNARPCRAMASAASRSIGWRLLRIKASAVVGSSLPILNSWLGVLKQTRVPGPQSNRCKSAREPAAGLPKQ